MSSIDKENFKFSDYVIDFERVKELTEGDVVKDKETFMGVKKDYSTTCSLLLNKIVGDFLKLESAKATFRLTDKMYFIINTLLQNKVLIKPRVLKIEKILKADDNV